MNAIYTSWGVCVCKQNKKHVELKQSNKQTFFLFVVILLLYGLHKRVLACSALSSQQLFACRERGVGGSGGEGRGKRATKTRSH